MLDDYKDKQPVIYRQLKNILNGNLSHAFIFVTNKNIYSEEIIISFAKSIVCPNNYINSKDCKECNVCERIDKKEYQEIKIIKPDGLWIKKDQLVEVQKDLSTKPIEGSKRVYLIYEADKMNKQASNSLLKFLEEPTEDIIAILITDNYNQILDTVASRCQTITFSNSNICECIKSYNYENTTLLKLFLMYQNEKDISEYMNNKDNMSFLDNVVKFVLKYEELKIKMICHAKKYFHSVFIEKEAICYAFEIITLYYKDVIQYKMKDKVDYFDNYINDIKKVADNNTQKQLIIKLNKILEHKEHVKNGMNINLLLEKLIIDLEGGKQDE